MRGHRAATRKGEKGRGGEEPREARGARDVAGSAWTKKTASRELAQREGPDAEETGGREKE